MSLPATNAELHGGQIQLETQGELPDIGCWVKGNEWVPFLSNEKQNNNGTDKRRRFLFRKMQA